MSIDLKVKKMRAFENCMMCGNDRDNIKPQKIVLGTNGGICVACIGACIPPTDDSLGTKSTNPAYSLAETGLCFMCSKNEDEVELPAGFYKGMHGDVCLHCTDLCLEIMKSEPAQS